MPFAADVAALATPPHAVVAPAAQPVWTTVTVRSGDTLWALALKHRTTTAAIVTKNRLARGGAVIHVGQKLLVPTAGAAQPTPGTPTTTAKPEPSPPKKATTAPRVHVVRSGETMSGIAARYRTSLGTLLAVNQLRASSYIFVGQRITIPGRGVVAKPAPTTKPAATAKPAATTKPAPTAKPVPKPAAAQPATTRAASVAASRARLAAMSVPSRTETADLIRSIATRHGVDPKLALAVGWLESGWYQRAVSSTNAVGVMQIMPVTGTWASQLAGRTLDLYDVRDNITAGVLVLRALQHMADSKDQAIAAYYQGLYSVRSRGLYTDTKAYVANIKAIYARL